MSRRSKVSAMTRKFGPLKPLDEVMEMLQYRSDHRETLDLGSAADLALHWQDQSGSHSQAGYYAKINGKELRLTDNALRLATKMVKSTPATWAQTVDRDAFPKFFNHVLDNRDNFDGLRVRHDGLQVNAILPADYRIKDANELLGDIVEPLKEHGGTIQGVSALDEDNGDITSLLIVVGENIVPSLRSEFGQYMMFLIKTSDHGAIDTHGVMGLFRTVCSNSAIREQQLTSWNHRSDFDNFWNRTMNTIRQFSYFGSEFSKVFEALNQTPLEVSASDLLRAMRNEKLIVNEHYEAATNWVDQPTEDGRTVTTQYDLFNVLTRAAQDLASIKAQHNAEAAAMKIFTSPGGIFERLRTAHEDRQFSGDIAEDEDGE